MPYITSVEQIGYDRGVAEESERSHEELLKAQRSIERLLERERTIAMNLLRQGLSIEVISEATGLSLTQLQEMQNQLS